MNIIAGILAACVVLLGGYFLWQNPRVEPTVESNDPAQEQLDMESAINTNTLPPDAVMEDGTMDPEIAATIRFTGDGYQPAMVTIKQGDTVRWVNDSQEETWPASAVHPTHGIYPEKSPEDCLGSSFDSCRGLAPGEAWDFTFNAKGTWRYHDHLKAFKTGTIIVE